MPLYIKSVIEDSNVEYNGDYYNDFELDVLNPNTVCDVIQKIIKRKKSLTTFYKRNNIYIEIISMNKSTANHLMGNSKYKNERFEYFMNSSKTLVSGINIDYNNNIEISTFCANIHITQFVPILDFNKDQKKKYQKSIANIYKYYSERCNDQKQFMFNVVNN